MQEKSDVFTRERKALEDQLDDRRTSFLIEQYECFFDIAKPLNHKDKLFVTRKGG